MTAICRRFARVSNNGRGLKLVGEVRGEEALDDSPVSNNGRGLKQLSDLYKTFPEPIRPLAITGVD